MYDNNQLPRIYLVECLMSGTRIAHRDIARILTVANECIHHGMRVHACLQRDKDKRTVVVRAERDALASYVAMCRAAMCSESREI